MFSKTTTNTQQPQPARPMAPSVPAADPMRRAAPKAASLLAGDLVFEGSISGDGELLIDGAVKGDIHVSRLIVGEHAHVEGTIRSTQVEIRGHVSGNIEGKSVRLLESAHVEGDITHEQLSIDTGAFFQGRCQQFRPAPQPAPMLSAMEPEPVHVMEMDEAQG